MSSCPPAGFASPTVETVIVATQGIFNLTHIIARPTSATHIHYQAFVHIKVANGAYDVLYPPLISTVFPNLTQISTDILHNGSLTLGTSIPTDTTLKWDAEAPSGPPSPDNVPALPAWLPIDKRCSGGTAIYHLKSLPDLLVEDREATTNYIVADWYFIRSIDGITSESTHLESSSFIVLKPAAAPPMPSTSSNASTVPAPTPTPSSTNTTGNVAGLTEGSTSQGHGISTEAALALQISMPLLAIIAMASAVWAWLRRLKGLGQRAEVSEHHMMQETDTTMRFEKPELEGTSVQPQELEPHHPTMEAVRRQNNQQGLELERTGQVDRGRVMSFELEAPLYGGSTVTRE